jgi:hypothetical protein
LIRRSIVDSKKWRLGKNNKRREQGVWRRAEGEGDEDRKRWMPDQS